MNDLTKKLTSLLEDGIAKGEIAGANLLVMKDGEEIVYTEAGYASVEEKKEYKRDTIFRMYSMTKPITAAAAMILLERGELELHQPVGDILEAFQNMEVWEGDKKVPARRNLLVKDLLSMTSGLSYGGEDPAGQEVWRILEEMDARLYGENPMSTMEIADRIGRCGLSFHPGDAWMYGTSADILGAVIEKISGMRFGEFLKKEIFEPLGMKDTDFYVPVEKRDHLAEAYEKTPEGVKKYVTNHLGIKYTLDIPPAFESGGAGLVSTLDDYNKFAQMLMGQGTYNGVQILKSNTVQFMTTAKLTPWQQETVWRSWEGLYGYGYGNLMRIMEEPGMAMFQTWKGEYGWDGWLGAYFCNSPANGVTILFSCQRRDGGGVDTIRRIRNVLGANLS